MSLDFMGVGDSAFFITADYPFLPSVKKITEITRLYNTIYVYIGILITVNIFRFAFTAMKREVK